MVSGNSVGKQRYALFNVKICIDDTKLKNMKFTGTIQNNSLNNVLYIMSLSYPLTYTMTDSVITVSSHKNKITIVDQKKSN